MIPKVKGAKVPQEMMEKRYGIYTPLTPLQNMQNVICMLHKFYKGSKNTDLVKCSIDFHLSKQHKLQARGKKGGC